MGVIWDFIASMMGESFPPKPKWTAEEIPDLAGKVVIMTGGSSGIGFEASKVLLAKGATVYIACRNPDVSTLDEVKGKPGAKFLRIDLADLDSVKAAAEEFLRVETRLDVLYCSGGVMIPPVDQLSTQGYDLQFAVHVLGHHYLFKLLLPVLQHTAKLDGKDKPRVIAVSSGAHHLHKLDFNTLKDGPARRKVSTEGLYAQSKFGTVVWAKELGRRYGDELVSLSLNPGNVATNLQRRVQGFQRSMISWMLHPMVPNGIVTHLYAGFAQETADCNGKYLIPWARVGKPRADTQNPEVGQELWDWLESQIAGRT